MKRWLIVLIALVVLLVPSTAFAATFQDVTVTATPSFMSISNSPGTWTINGISGTGIIQPNTTYYAKGGANETTPPSATVLDAECHFTVTNSSSVNITLTVTWGAFTAGGADMTNSNAGTNGATTYGAYCWYSGMTYTGKVIVKSTGSGAMLTGMTPATTTKKWGVEILTRTDVWTSGTSSTSTLTITATAS